MKVIHYTQQFVYKAVLLTVSWFFFPVTVERSGFSTSDFWSIFVILDGAQDAAGLSGSAFGLYQFPFYS